MKIALFGGSFDPVHSEHVRLVRAAIRALNPEKVFVIPSYTAPHKEFGAACSGEERFKMCEIAFRGEPEVQISPFELEQKGTSYTYLTCRYFKERFPDAQLYWLVGADMLEDFFSWRNPEEIVSLATVAACGRGGACPDLHRKFVSRFGCDYLEIGFEGAEISSTRLRCELAFGKKPAGLNDEVYAYLKARGWYQYPQIAPALALEKPERREHSFRAAAMATERARSAGVSERKCLLAAALHDCGKYVPLTSPLLKGFTPPEGVPAPVLHQYTGAYLAEHEFGVTDGEILNAIRYHTSGRANMTELEKLIYLADMLEEGRDFPGVEALRKLFYTDLNACLYAALQQQTAYLAEQGKSVYPLTQEAYLWIKSIIKAEKT